MRVAPGVTGLLHNTRFAPEWGGGSMLMDPCPLASKRRVLKLNYRERCSALLTGNLWTDRVQVSDDVTYNEPVNHQCNITSTRMCTSAKKKKEMLCSRTWQRVLSSGSCCACVHMSLLDGRWGGRARQSQHHSIQSSSTVTRTAKGAVQQPTGYILLALPRFKLKSWRG